MRSLFIAPSGIEGFLFINEAGETFLLTNNEFSPTDMGTEGLEQVSFDISIQAVLNNAQLKFDEIKAEIETAIANFE